jgi:hypothetical protein
VQRSFDGPTKAEDVRYVPILDMLLPSLRRWRLTHPGRLVFTNRDGRMFGPSARVFQEVLHRVLRRADRLLPFPINSMSSRYGSHALAAGAWPGAAKIVGSESVDTPSRLAGFASAAPSESVDTPSASPRLTRVT